MVEQRGGVGRGGGKGSEPRYLTQARVVWPLEFREIREHEVRGGPEKNRDPEGNEGGGGGRENSLP